MKLPLNLGHTDKTSGSCPAPLRDVLGQERQAIESRRKACSPPVEAKAPLTGIGLSGGGIRSATFCLGFLQSLSEKGLLRHFDYVSMVSGGGYVGGWWSAWLSRKDQPGRGLFPAQEEIEPLEPGEGEQRRLRGPIKHLRLFSNYITPRKGAFSADTWQAIAVASRNLVLTWMVLLPLLFAALCFAQLSIVAQPAAGQAYLRSHEFASRWAAVAPTFAVLGLVCFVLLFALIALWLIVTGDYGHRGYLVAAAVGQGLFVALGVFHPELSKLLHWRWGLSDPVHQSMVATWALPAFTLLICYLVLNRSDRATHEVWRQRKEVARSRLMRAHAATLVAALLAGLVLLCASFGDLVWQHLVLGVGQGVRGQVQQAGGIAALVLSLGSALLAAFKAAPMGGADVSASAKPSVLTRAALAISPTLVLIVLAAAGAWLARGAIEVVRAGVVDELGRPTPPLDPGRSLYEWVMISALAGIALCQILALTEVLRRMPPPANVLLPLACGSLWVFREALPAAPQAFVLSAVVLFALALLLAIWRLTRAAAITPAGRPMGRSAGAVWGAFALILLALVSTLALHDGPWLATIPLGRAERTYEAAILLVLGAAIVAAGAIYRALSPRALLLLTLPALVGVPLALLNLAPAELRWTWDAAAVIGIGGTALTAAIGLGWMTDPNLISLHGFYRARLVRAYLGASNPTRGHAEVTEAVAEDDLPLHEVVNHTQGAPYPLLNTTLNLVAAQDLATSQRISASFLLSPLYCGSLRTGFRPTCEYMSGALTLGAAMAISGAAASPAMGAVRLSSAQAMLLTLLNIRLGFWAPHPAKESWQSPQARMWTFYTLREFLSQTDETSTYCYLTDGGHFDNTGIYELVQRACQRIVIVDCGHDPGRPPALSDLGRAIRLCRIDFNAEITIDVQTLQGSDSPGLVEGTIRYSAPHLDALGLGPERQNAQLIWIKPSTSPTDVIAADVRQYARAFAEFPQQSTGDLWYDEAQFESYRKLGFGAAAGLAKAFERVAAPQSPSGNGIASAPAAREGDQGRL